MFLFADKIILKPVDGGVLQMRPSMRHMNTGKREIETASHGTSNAPVKALQLAFKKKETEEEISARLKSYSYLQRLANEEPWIPLQCDPSWHAPENSIDSAVKPLVIEKEKLENFNLNSFIK